MFFGWSSSLRRAIPTLLPPTSSENSAAARRCGVLHRHLSLGGPRRRMETQTTSQNPDEVLYTKDASGGVATITLNRPKALHALNLNMLQLMTQHLKAAAADSDVKVVVVEASGEKAFCAGGDVRSITEAGKVGGHLTKTFFRVEYALNYFTGTFPKPYIAIQDGITMGGDLGQPIHEKRMKLYEGVGISVHGPFRVATEHTLFAMPETFLGFFPDVGGSHFLPRLKGSLGMYIALTGQRLKARDVVFAGIATHFIPRSQISALKERLTSLSSENGAMHIASPDRHKALVQEELDRLHQQNMQQFPQEEFSLAPHLNTINRCFNRPSVEEVLVALKEENSDWASKQLEILSRMSPTSLKISHRQLMEGAKLSFAECFMMEYRMAQGCVTGTDFYEGVRAILIDKDNKPTWNPPTIEEVTPEIVDRHFAPSSEDLIVQS